MKRIILDSNIVISALISPKGAVADILFNQLRNYNVLSCYFLYVEIFNKKEKLLKISKLSEQDFLELLYLLIRKIDFINESQIPVDIWQQAMELTKDIDIKDSAFVALSLFTNAPLWTGDKVLYNWVEKEKFSSRLELN